MIVTVNLRLPRWWRAYGRAVVVWAFLTGREPDYERMSHFIALYMRLVVNEVPL